MKNVKNRSQTGVQKAEVEYCHYLLGGWMDGWIGGLVGE
jgi:hypothetical protein